MRLSFAIIETTDDRSHCAVPFSDQLRGSGARDVGVVEPRDGFRVCAGDSEGEIVQPLAEPSRNLNLRSRP